MPEHIADESLPIHPRTGESALGLRRDGRPIWPIKGGSGEGGDPAPAGEPNTPPAGDPSPAPNTDPGTPPARTRAPRSSSPKPRPEPSRPPPSATSCAPRSTR